MEKRLGIILVISVLVLSGCASGWSAEWKQFFKTEYSQYYYDSETLAYPTDMNVKASVKLVFTDKGVQSTVETLGRGYQNLEYSIQSLEINCAVKTLNLLRVVAYSKSGDVISREEYTSSDWRSISTKTPYEALMRAVCKPPKRQR